MDKPEPDVRVSLVTTAAVASACAAAASSISLSLDHPWAFNRLPGTKQCQDYRIVPPTLQPLRQKHHHALKYFDVRPSPQKKPLNWLQMAMLEKDLQIRYKMGIKMPRWLLVSSFCRISLGCPQRQRSWKGSRFGYSPEAKLGTSRHIQLIICNQKWDNSASKADINRLYLLGPQALPRRTNHLDSSQWLQQDKDSVVLTSEILEPDDVQGT